MDFHIISTTPLRLMWEKGPGDEGLFSSPKSVQAFGLNTGFLSGLIRWINKTRSRASPKDASPLKG